MVKHTPECSYLEKLLVPNDGSGFTLRTSYNEENKLQANKLFQENYQFNNLRDQKIDKIQPLKETNAEKRERLEQKQNTLDQWYGLQKKTNLTLEEKNQLVLLKLKGYINPKMHFKSSDMKNIPKYFQVGTVIGGSDYGVGIEKISRKKRQNNIANELIELDKKAQFTKKKFGEIQKNKFKIAKVSKLQKKLKKTLNI
ncbi:interacting protein 2, putative [Ichthyophthirius multifiliis]|uniref:Interacting protein 2, putative n=1 Tax=Ichthyophthirius multifiliis TaxID=5932 RepID=G0QS63_ICHMU|nr:interacting protein 2, putative [Ichthyophthirius multifiliis]EGR31928.1 interacting protein 2, putative [Ichthyophthirius multifiliis]|eukprot:XP_004035414.1 interacting protein 2, putative [Ichthyophthirius multifiliis]